jgi:hypothetical protein
LKGHRSHMTSLDSTAHWRGFGTRLRCAACRHSLRYLCNHNPSAGPWAAVRSSHQHNTQLPSFQPVLSRFSTLCIGVPWHLDMHSRRHVSCLQGWHVKGHLDQVCDCVSADSGTALCSWYCWVPAQASCGSSWQAAPALSVFVEVLPLLKMLQSLLRKRRFSFEVGRPCLCTALHVVCLVVTL